MDAPKAPDPDTVRQCLEKILQDQTFATSDRLTAFLRYIVTETLEDRGSRLKGYNVALSVFSRGETFDPQTNSVVRVEATRLRKQLAAYYAGPGADDPIEIRVNRGSYVPEFIVRPEIGDVVPAEDASQALPSAEDEAPSPPIRSSKSRNTRVLAGAAALGLLAFAAAILLPPLLTPRQPVHEANRDPLALAQAPTWSLPPSIAVSQLERPPDSALSAFQASTLVREIASALGQFDSVRVRAADAGAVAAPGTEYILSGSVARSGDQFNVSFRLVRSSDSQIVWSKTYEHVPADFTADRRLPVVADIASTLGRTYGVIFADRYKHMPDLGPQTNGFACIMHGSRYFNAPTQQAFDEACACLDRTVTAEPKSSLGHAMLAIVLIDGYLKGYKLGNDDLLARAATAAHEAVDLAPQSARAHLALFMAHFYEKRFDNAFEAAQRALALNPFSMEIKSRVGSAYALRGDHEASLKLLNDVQSRAENGAGWLQFYFFLNAYAAGDVDLAARHAMVAPTTRTPLGLLARIVVEARGGNGELIAKWKGHLAERFPQFASDIPGALSRLAMAEPIKARLLADLATAGSLIKPAQP